MYNIYDELTIRVWIYTAVLNYRRTNLSGPYFERALSNELFSCTTGRYRNNKNKYI